MTSTNPTQPKRTAPPAAGSRPSVRIDDTLAADLADLMSTMGPGGTFADAVRQAVGQLAQQYRTAWAHGIVPRGTAPTLGAYQFIEHRPDVRSTSGYDALSDAAPGRAPRSVNRMLPSPPPGPHVRPQFTEEPLGRPTWAARPDAERPAHT